jgi:hypothetical protein
MLAQGAREATDGVSSGYVKRQGSWKMAFHQQTPLPPKQ